MLCSPATEAKAGIDLQGASHYQESIAGINRRHAVFDAPPWHSAAEEHHVWHQGAAAGVTVRYHEATDFCLWHIGIAVRTNLKSTAQCLGVVAFKALLRHLASLMLMALQTYDTIKSTVQVNYISAPGALMQSVNVLGDQKINVPPLFQIG
jgi:hypothetical protein